MRVDDVLSPPGVETSDAALLLVKGKAACRSGDIDAAMGFFRAAVQAAPEHPTIQLEAAETLYEVGDLLHAEQSFLKVIERSPRLILPHIRLGFCARSRNDRAAAAAWFDAASKIDPVHIGVRMEAAADLRALERLQEAELVYLSVLAISSSHVQAHVGLAQCARQRGDRAASLAGFQAASSLEPTNFGVRMEAAADLRELHKVDESEAAYQSVLLLITGHLAQAHIGIAHCARRRGDRVTSLANFQAASAADPSNIWAEMEAAADLRELGRIDEAEAGYRKVLTVMPDQAQALSGLGHCARRRGDRLASLAKFEATLVSNPSDVWARLEAAQDLRALNRFDEAQKVYEEILILQPTNSAALIGLGFLSRRSGDRLSARNFIEQALAGDPNNVSALLELANEQRDGGATDTARETVQRALLIDAGNLHAWTILGFVERAAGAHEQALAAFQQARSRYPMHAQTLVEMAIEERQLGRGENCTKLLAQALEQDPNCSYAIIQSAEQAMTAQNADLALELYRRGLEQQPMQTGLQLGMARTLMALGQADKAFSLLASFAAKVGDLPEIQGTRIFLHRQNGDLHQALAIARKVRVSAPENFQIWIELCHLELMLGSDQDVSLTLASSPAQTQQDRARLARLNGLFAERRFAFDEASSFYENAVALNPKDASVRFELVRLNTMLFQADKARQHLSAFCAINAPAARLQGKSTNVSQTHFGQILDEYAMDTTLTDSLRNLQDLDPRVRVGPLATIIRNNPGSTAASISLMLALRQIGLFSNTGEQADNMSRPLHIPSQIIQYWDTEEPPDDIVGLMQSWRGLNPDFSYKLFNDHTARSFLAERFPRPVLLAYHRVEEPARKADIFRLAYLLAEGGFYIDADDRCLAPLCTLIPRHAQFVAYQEDLGTLGNNFIAVKPHHPVLLMALRLATIAINRGDADTVWLSTGPALLTRAFTQKLVEAKQNHVALPEGTLVLERRELYQAVAIHCLAGYKTTERHWSNTAFSRKKVPSLIVPN